MSNLLGSERFRSPARYFDTRRPCPSREFPAWTRSGTSRSPRNSPSRANCAGRRRQPSATRGTSCGIVAFHCIAERLVIELEGGPHDDPNQQWYDAARTQVLEAAGYRVVRLRNRDVTRHHLERILRKALGRSSIVPPLPKGEGDRR